MAVRDIAEMPKEVADLAAAQAKLLAAAELKTRAKRTLHAWEDLQFGDEEFFHNPARGVALKIAFGHLKEALEDYCNAG